MNQNPIDTSKYISYVVTGRTTRGKPFRINTANIYYALGINLYRGTVWGLLPTGKRQQLKQVWN